MGLRKLGDSAYLYPGSPSTFVRVFEGRAVIVDPGHGSGRHRDLKREVKKLGVGIELQLATHGHADHVAVAPRLEAPLLLHRFEFSIAESPLNRELLTFGSKAPEGFLVFQFQDEVKVHGIFEWGDEINGLKALRLDGHSPGMTGFLDGENGVIYAGDAFFGERVIESVGVPYLVEPGLFKASIEKLRNYAEKGFLLVPSHGKPVKGEEAVELLDLNARRIGEVERLIPELLRKPMSLDELAFRIMQSYDVKPTPQKLALNLVPLRAFVATLYNEGKIEAFVDRGLKWRTSE
ncbi:Zn-dependent hydrolase [Thermococcus sp. P6]|uniref:MBL fold metallo-hydrolase n=1 Tax=Thermococcus sp. P6 TaxID=122420 RepID=UPI000B59E2E9|nr:MBL fold metallo-hydrolase [Thermococcus sp. P6]ASJ11208.1 Zn-dependent hydrolase [Thermococcus sp. P6]